MCYTKESWNYHYVAVSLFFFFLPKPVSTRNVPKDAFGPAGYGVC